MKVIVRTVNGSCCELSPGDRWTCDDLRAEVQRSRARRTRPTRSAEKRGLRRGTRTGLGPGQRIADLGRETCRIRSRASFVV